MQLTTLAAKAQILENAGYKYNFDREMYLNRNQKKGFSVEFVEDNTEDELQRSIGEETPGTEWRFFFNVPPTDAVKRELMNILG